MLTKCHDCEHHAFVPHSCGHRHCPHCQSHESEQWIQRQLKKNINADYFMVTFTLPAEFRKLVWRHQRSLYDLLVKSAWETLKTFSQKDKQLQGIPGAVAVLHTHSRELNFHPHVHIVIPAAAVDPDKRIFRTKQLEPSQKKPFLFHHKALAKVFRAMMLKGIKQHDLPLPIKYPEEWVVDVKHVGQGDKALVYLGRYLYRGVIQEKHIMTNQNGEVTFRYQDSKTKQWKNKTVKGQDFIWLVLQHTLPRGFRRARNFGFLHPNSKRLMLIIQMVTQVNPSRYLHWLKPRPVMRCTCCGGIMKIIKTRIPTIKISPPWVPI